MDFRTLWLTTPMDSRHKMVRRLGSTYKYLQKLAGQFGQPSSKLALKMVQLYPELTLEELLSPPAKAPARRGAAPKTKPAPKGKRGK